MLAMQQQFRQQERRQAVDPRHLLASLRAHATGLPNDDVFASMLATWYSGGGALPRCLGLSDPQFGALLQRHFPGFVPPTRDDGDDLELERAPERDDLLALMVDNRAGNDPSEEWMAAIVVAGCMGNDHLWQDLGLWSRAELTALMERNFPALAARNDRNMKWKKFLYKQLCNAEGVYVCRAPSCEVCADFDHCFGEER